jgi:hypothetical protein
MIIFIHEDRGYLNWVAHHHQGFVLDGRRRPKANHLVLHRATCPDIKRANSKRTSWTKGAKLKACSMDRDELMNWAVDESGNSARPCEKCRPALDTPKDGTGEIHLTKLGADILDYVLDASLVHLDHEQPPYRLTVRDIAACFGKTSGQLSPALHRLVNDGLLTMDGTQRNAVAIPPKRIVWPTIRAFRTLPAFEAESDAMIQADLAKLQTNRDLPPVTRSTAGSGSTTTENRQCPLG